MAENIFSKGSIEIFLLAKKHKGNYSQIKPKTKNLQQIKDSY